jgi:hypothetical protein
MRLLNRRRSDILDDNRSDGKGTTDLFFLSGTPGCRLSLFVLLPYSHIRLRNTTRVFTASDTHWLRFLLSSAVPSNGRIYDTHDHGDTNKLC